MNEKQRAVAGSSDDLCRLFLALDNTSDSLPEDVKLAYDQVRGSLCYGCHCDLEHGQAPDDCVLDGGRPEDCHYTRQLIEKGQGKESCEYWRPIAIVRASAVAVA